MKRRRSSRTPGPLLRHPIRRSCTSPRAQPKSLGDSTCDTRPPRLPTAGGLLAAAIEPASPVCTSDRASSERRRSGDHEGHAEASALFDFADKSCEDCYRVLDVSGYYSAVRAELASRGVCTLSDMEEVGAKDSNESSEQFDILLASGHIRRGPGMYRGICYPAIF
jgi:hypothetical protein